MPEILPVDEAVGDAVDRQRLRPVRLGAGQPLREDRGMARQIVHQGVPVAVQRVMDALFDHEAQVGVPSGDRLEAGIAAGEQQDFHVMFEMAAWAGARVK